MATPAAVLSIIVEANTGKAKAELDRFNKGLDDKSIKVTATIDKTSFARAKQVAGSLGGVEEVKLSADVDTSSFARAKAVMAVLGKQGDSLGNVFDRSQLSIGQWTGILAAALPVVVDMAGALGALTASAAAATAGLGALAIGGGAAATVGFGGIAAIAAPAIGSLKDLITAQQAHNKAVTTGGASAARAAVANAQQMKAATDAVATAEDNLKVAQETETTAQKALTLARKDAVRQLQDMRRAAIEGGTSEKRARLSIEQAEKNLRDVRASSTSTSLDIRDAELSVTEARQNAKDVSIQAERAQQDFNKAQKKGIDQMPGVVSAQQSLDSATRGVTSAQQDVAKAIQNVADQQKQANMATEAGGTSLAALALAQKKAGPAAVKFAKNLKGMSQEWKSLTKAGRSDFFGMLNDGLKKTQGMLPMLAASANKSMGALRGGFDQFLDKATGPEFKGFIHTMTDTFAKSMRPLGDAFGNIAKVLQRIAVAVAPDLLRMFKGFDEMTKGWVDSTRNAKDLEDTVHGLVNQANAWWKLIKATAGLIAAVLIPGMGQGKKAVEGITASIKEWTDWVNAHPAEMRDFFKEGLKTTSELFKVLTGFLPALFQISSAMRPIARAFLGILKGLNSLKIGNVTALTVLLGAMVGAKVAKGVAGMIGAFNALKVAALGAAAAEATAASVPTKGFAPVKGGGVAPPVVAPTGLKGIVGDTAALAKYAKVAGGAALAITAVVGAVEAMRTNFLGVRSVFVGFFTHVLTPLGDAFTKLIDELSGGHAGEVFGAVAKAFKVMARPLGFVVRNLTKFIGLLAIGGIAATFATAMVVIIGPLWVFIKAMTLVVKGLKKMGDVAVGVAHSMAKVFTASWGKIKDVFQSGSGVALGAFKRFGGGIHDVADGIGHVFRSLYLVIKKVATWIGNQVNKVGNALGGLKDKIPHLGIDLSLPDIPSPFKRGGHVPGAGDGDKVPAMLEPGEGVINKKAVAKMGGKRAIDRINQAVPRFKKGGTVGGGLDFALGPQTIPPIQADPDHQDHIHVSANSIPWLIGIGHKLQQMGNSVGEFAPTKFGNPYHFGPITTSRHAHYPHDHYSGFAFDVNHDPTEGPAWERAVANVLSGGAGGSGVAAGVAAVIGKIKVKGKGPGAEIAQMAADKMRKQANKYLAKLAPKDPGGSFVDVAAGGGSVVSQMGKILLGNQFSRAGAAGIIGNAYRESLWNPASIGSGGGGLFGFTTGAVSLAALQNYAKKKGKSWTDVPTQMEFMLAGSGSGGLMSGSSYNALESFLKSTKDTNAATSRFMTEWERPAPATAALDIRQSAARRALHMFGEGGVVGPYVGSFAKGGEVAKTGLAHVHKGEHITPMERLEHEGRVARRRARRVGDRLEHEQAKEHPDKQLVHHLKKLEERIRDLVAQNKELIQEQKTLRTDLKEHNRLVKTIRANEKAALAAVVNLTASQIGAQGMQKGRNASPGRAVRY